MKNSKFKSLIIVAAVVFISGIATDTVYAQRGGRGGGGGGGGSRSSQGGGGGGGGARMSQGGGGSRSFQGGGRRSSGGGNARMSQGGGSRAFQGGGQANIRRGGNLQGGGNRIAQGPRNRAFQGGGNRSFQGGNSRSFQRGGNRAFYGRGNRGYYGGARIGRYGRSYYGRGFGGFNRPYYNYYRPFLGISIGVLPFGYYPFYYGANQFYYSGGLFYQQYENEYKVVVPPVGAEVPTLPSEAQEVVINGETYYEYKGVYYTTAANADGKTVYVVAGKDGVLNTADGDVNAENLPQVGEIVSALPDGAREVMLKGQKFYVSEDGIYYEEFIDSNNKTSYKVVAN